MNKILDIGEIFDLKLVSLSIPVLISIIVGSIALFLFTNKGKKKNIPESKNTRKLENSGVNDSGKKKKRGTNEGEGKTNVAPVKREKQVKSSSSPAKKQTTSTNVPTPSKKSAKKAEENKSKEVKPKKDAIPVVADTNEGEGWQTVTKKQKKQSEQVKVVPKEQAKTSPKKRQEKVSKATEENKKTSVVPETSTLQVEADAVQPATLQESEWIESQPTKKNKKRALRE